MNKFSIRTLLLIVIGVLNILIAAPLGYLTYESFLNYQNAQKIKHVAHTTHLLYSAKKFLSLERASGVSLLYLSASSAQELQEEILENRHEADDMLDTALNVLEDIEDPKLRADIADTKEAYADLRSMRIKFNAAILHRERKQNLILPDQYFQRVTILNEKIQKLIDDYSNRLVLLSPEIIRQMRQTRLIWEVSEYAGQEYAILGRLIAQNKYPDAETRKKLITLRGRIQYGLEIAQGSVANSRWHKEIAPSLEEARTHYLMIFEQTKDVFYEEDMSTDAVYSVSAQMWLQLASEAVNSLHQMTGAVLKVNNTYIEEIESNALKSIYSSIFLLLSALALSAYTWWLITSRVVNPVNEMVGALYKETKLSAEEVNQQDSLDEITKLKQVLEVFRENSRQLEKERDNAEAANIAKSEFLANMSHEIRTPMNVVVGLSNILGRTEPLTEKQAEFIRTLQISADTLLSLINDLLDFSKIESQNFELEKTRFDLAQLIEDLSIIKTFKAKEKKLDFRTHMQGIEGKEYEGDPTRIRQILVNLCGNAIKFTPSGSIHLNVAAHPNSEDNYDRIEIIVADTGIGIPPDKMETVFEKFTQADASVVRKYGGTGLGLTITKSLVEMMGGEIKVQSTLDEGTTFYVNFPLRVTARKKHALSKMPGKSKGKSSRKVKKVLLVEDYQPNAIVAGTILEEFGYEYDIAESGQEAVKKYIADGYDAILMDIQMPGMDGYQATQAIREYEKKSSAKPVKIIGLTAHASVKDKEKCLDVGMDDYIPKPFDRNELKQKLEM